MTCHLSKQAAYAAKRRSVTGTTAIALRTYRVTFADGAEVFERRIGLSQVAAQWPDAWRVEWVKDESGQFW